MNVTEGCHANMACGWESLQAVSVMRAGVESWEQEGSSEQENVKKVIRCPDITCLVVTV